MSSLLPARRYVSAVLAMALCPSSVCLSVTSRYCIETAERIELVFSTEAPSAYPTLYYKRIRVYPKIRILPRELYPKLWNFDTAHRPSQVLDERRQFITLSVHLCVQHDERDAQRRLGPTETQLKLVKIMTPKYTSNISRQFTV